MLMRLRRSAGVALSIVLGVTAPAWPCSVVRPATQEQVVDAATVIVRARVLGRSSIAGPPVFAMMASPMLASLPYLRFDVVEVLKGTLGARTLRLPGSLDDEVGVVPQPVAGRAARHVIWRGTCHRTSYRIGAEYLLLLKESGWPFVGERYPLGPYWASTAPTNKRIVSGTSDPWLAWVRARLQSAPEETP